MNNRFIPSFGRQVENVEDECVMSGSLHELLRGRSAAVVQEEKLPQPVSTHTPHCAFLTSDSSDHRTVRRHYCTDCIFRHIAGEDESICFVKKPGITRFTS